MRIWVKSDSESSYLQATEVTTEGMPEISVEEKPKLEKDEDHEEIQTDIAERELLKVLYMNHKILSQTSWSCFFYHYRVCKGIGDNT